MIWLTKPKYIPIESIFCFQWLVFQRHLCSPVGMCLSSFPDDQWWNLSHGILLSRGFLPARCLYPWHVLRDPRAATPNRCILVILLIYIVLHTFKSISSEECFLYTQLTSAVMSDHYIWTLQRIGRLDVMGFVWFLTGNCSAGWYCNHTSSTKYQHVCPAGSYCPSGSDIPTPCPAGTYSGLDNNGAVSDCLNCTAGHYCHGNTQHLFSLNTVVMSSATQVPTSTCRFSKELM